MPTEWIRVSIPYLIPIEGEVTNEKVSEQVRLWFTEIQKQGAVLVVTPDTNVLVNLKPDA